MLRSFHRTTLLIFAFMVAVITLARPVKSTYYVLEAIATHHSEHFFFNYRKISGPLVSMPDKLQAFSPKLMAPKETIDTMLRLKTLVAERRVKAEDFRVLNISELTPIYAELNVPPPTGLPLWFHSNLTLFPEQLEELNSILTGSNYDLILIQGTHEGLSQSYINLISTLDGNPSYNRLQVLKNSPSNFTCSVGCQGEIFIYRKINLF
jgi:hypothetical protein